MDTRNEVERVKSASDEPRVIEMGRVSEETKGDLHTPGESVMQPITED